MIPSRLAILAAAVLAVGVAFWGYGRYQYQQGVQDTRMQAQLEAFRAYQADVERMNAESQRLQDRIRELENAEPEVITKYRDRVVQVPLPADCRIDDGRLFDIQDAYRKSGVIPEPSR